MTSLLGGLASVEVEVDEGGEQGLTGSRYPTRPDLFFNYPTRPVPKFENDRVAGNKYFILTAIRRSI